MSDYPFLSDPGKIPNDTPSEQQSNFRDAGNVRPANIVGDMHDHPPALNVQTLPVVASGDMVSGGFESHVDRTPRIAALPDNA